jgi:hypothetical protein
VSVNDDADCSFDGRRGCTDTSYRRITCPHQLPGYSTFRARRQPSAGGAQPLVSSVKAPTSSTRLGMCEGDCNTDLECAGSLFCFHRDDNEHVPGCAAAGSKRGWDYCTDVAYVLEQPIKPWRRFNHDLHATSDA